MGWNALSILKLQRLHRWSLGMDKLFHPTLHKGCNYLSMLGLKLIQVSKKGSRCDRWRLRCCEYFPHIFIFPHNNQCIVYCFHVTDPLWGEYTGQVTRSFDVFFDLRLNIRRSKQSKRRWFETPPRSLSRHCNYWILFYETLLQPEALVQLGKTSFSISLNGWCSEYLPGR